MNQERMNSKVETTRIKLFWKWFEDNEARIRDLLDNDSSGDRAAFIQAMDNQILEFGMFTWEIGHGSNKPFFLTISPNGNWERMELSRLIMKSAPNLADWEFNYAQPLKDWDLTFRLFDNHMIERTLDASGWKFVAERLSGNKVKITIEAGNIAGLDFDTQLAAGNLVITNMLGEECKINHVDKIEMVSEFGQQQKASASIIASLKQRFDEII